MGVLSFVNAIVENICMVSQVNAKRVLVELHAHKEVQILTGSFATLHYMPLVVLHHAVYVQQDGIQRLVQPVLHVYQENILMIALPLVKHVHLGHIPPIQVCLTAHPVMQAHMPVVTGARHVSLACLVPATTFS